jgi:hypothetical protein
MPNEGTAVMTGAQQRAVKAVEKLAGATGLEPAASCVTGRRSNQLNYAPALKLQLLYLLPFPSVPVHSQKFPKVP